MNKTQKSGATVGTASSDNKQQPDSAFITEVLSRDNDVSGESDLEYFRARPEARTRIRAAFDGEFPADLLPDARGRTLLVIVAIQRDLAGQPLHRARGLILAAGGSA